MSIKIILRKNKNKYITSYFPGIDTYVYLYIILFYNFVKYYDCPNKNIFVSLPFDILKNIFNHI